MVYIVTEYVRGKTIKELLDEDLRNPRLRECYDQVARAIEFFLSIHPNIDTTPPGPVGGRVIRHPIFRRATAPREYSSVADLQEHVEAVLYSQCSTRNSRADYLAKVANYRPNNNHRIDFSDESLCFCYSDLYEENFISTDSGILYVIDFGHASFLPTSFMTYALDRPRSVCSEIKGEFQLPKGNLEALKAASYYFMKGAR
jgi:serine/threonine protein kinase